MRVLLALVACHHQVVAAAGPSASSSRPAEVCDTRMRMHMYTYEDMGARSSIGLSPGGAGFVRRSRFEARGCYPETALNINIIIIIISSSITTINIIIITIIIRC